jgi:hypothetical protein
MMGTNEGKAAPAGSLDIATGALSDWPGAWLLGAEAEGEGERKHPLGFRWWPAALRRDGLVEAEVAGRWVLLFDRARAPAEVWELLGGWLARRKPQLVVVDEAELAELLGPAGMHAPLPAALQGVPRLLLTGPWQAWAADRERRWQGVAALSGRSFGRRVTAPTATPTRGGAERLDAVGVAGGTVELEFQAEGRFAVHTLRAPLPEDEADALAVRAREPSVRAFSEALALPGIGASDATLVFLHRAEAAGFPVELLGTERGPLGLTRPVVRALRVSARAEMPPPPSGRLRVLLATLTSDRLAGPALKDQVEHIERVLRSSPLPMHIEVATGWRVEDLRRGPGWHILHIATHGTDGRSLMTADGPCRAEDLQLGYRPGLVFLSACEAADADGDPGRSLTDAFGALGCEALIGPRARITPEVAHMAATAVYEGLVAGVTLAEAVLEMRRSLWHRGYPGALVNLLQYGGEQLTLSGLMA